MTNCDSILLHLSTEWKRYERSNSIHFVLYHFNVCLCLVNVTSLFRPDIHLCPTPARPSIHPSTYHLTYNPTTWRATATTTTCCLFPKWLCCVVVVFGIWILCLTISEVTSHVFYYVYSACPLLRHNLSMGQRLDIYLTSYFGRLVFMTNWMIP